MIKVINSLIFLFALLFSNLNANEMFQTVEAKDATLIKSDSSKDFCNVCGMHLTKYYKTNHTAEFRNGHKEQYCSMHCLAEVHKNYADKIKLTQVVDTNSLKFIDAKKAFYVVGSSKEGTMSSISEYAFLNKEDAIKFKNEFNGEIKSFEETLKTSKDNLANDNIILDEKRIPMAKKGKKIYETMCKNVAQEFNSIGEVKQYLIDNSNCQNLDSQMLQAVSIYLYEPMLAADKSKMIEIPQDAKCPVCGMFVTKYPKWVAQIQLQDGHSHYFDGVKDMMKFYFNPTKYHSHSSEQISQINVTDYYNIESIDAKKAFYVIGSNVYGPMGEELIPFKSEEEAKKFMNDHFGKKVVGFDEIKEDLFK